MSELPFSVIEKRIAKRLEIRRKLLGISQKNLANACSLSLEKYRKFENAEETILPCELTLIAKTLNVPLLYFYWEEGVSDTLH